MIKQLNNIALLSGSPSDLDNPAKRSENILVVVRYRSLAVAHGGTVEVWRADVWNVEHISSESY